MTGKSFEIRRMERHELSQAADWAAAEGWNPGLNEAPCFYAADPSGFFLGLLDGEPIACISGVAYDETFGFLGFYIVKPEHRGKGYGLRIWQACMDYLAARNVGLDGVVDQQANYRKSGFRLAYNNIRYLGRGEAGELSGVVPLSHLPFAEVEAYDRGCFPVARSSFLAAWLSMQDSTAFGLRREGRLAGYGAIRRCREGHKIGPLFADDAAAAEALYQALSAQVPGEAVFLDIPDVNPAAKALVARHDMTPVFETARMYTGAEPKIDLTKVYGVTTFELG
ncbi:MAG: GNAT family N-acetyltransferase [Rhodovibrionaceae bacterium]